MFVDLNLSLIIRTYFLFRYIVSSTFSTHILVCRILQEFRGMYVFGFFAQSPLKKNPHFHCISNRPP